jgi:hypothetical protein
MFYVINVLLSWFDEGKLTETELAVRLQDLE